MAAENVGSSRRHAFARNPRRRHAGEASRADGRPNPIEPNEPHIIASRPYTEARKLRMRIGKSGLTVLSIFGRAMVLNFGRTSPISPGMYQRTPRSLRNPSTALNDQRSS